MNEKLKQTIKEEIGKLQEVAQKAIDAFDWTKIIEEIGKKHLLTEDEINDLQLETLLVLVGATNADNYAENVENEIGTSKAEAEKIAQEALEKIFTPISNKIEELLKKNEKNKNHRWDQNLNFILSGGDYSALVAPKPEEVGDDTNSDDSKIQIISKSKIEDIRSKFTI